MDNIDGALGFKATLDIDDFKVSSQAMEQRIKQVSGSTVSESAKMEESIQNFAINGARYITSYLVGQGMVGLLQSMVQTRGQFQQLEIAFETMLGSGTKAKALMDQMVQTAATTPFDLMGVAGGAKQLLAYGAAADKVNDILVRLGNIASGLSIPLNDIVYLYGTTMVQGRLYAQDVRQFTGRGIPLVRELASMYGKTTEEINAMVTAGKIGFSEVEKVINKLTNSGGQFYNLMEKQSKSLTGLISNLGDAWDSALNKIGTDHQELFATGISGAINLVENMDEVVKIIKTITIAYGSYRAALALNTLATKGYTGVSLIDNTVKSAQLSLLKAGAALTGENIAQTKLMTAARIEHVAALQKELSAEQLANVQKQIRIATIQSLLTAQQQEYLSNLNITASSANYETVAMGVLNAEQRLAISKLDMSAKSAVYRAALEQEVAAQKQSQLATLTSMRTEVKAAAAKLEAAREKTVLARQNVVAAQQEVSASYRLAGAEAYQTAQSKLAAATDALRIRQKEQLALQSDFLAKKQLLEATAAKQSAAASITDTTAKGAQTTATSILSAITTKCGMAMKTLWATMKANPIGWIISLLGLAYSAYVMFFDKQEDGTDTVKGLAKATKDATEKFNEQAGKVDALRKVLNDANISYYSRNKALAELKEIIPGYNAELTKEGKIIKDNTDAIEKYLTALEKQIKLKAAQDELAEAYKKKRALEKDESTQSNEYMDIRSTNTLQGYDRNSFTAKVSRLFGTEKESKAKEALDKTRKDLEEVNTTINDLNKEISDTSTSIDESTKSAKSYSDQVKETRAQISSLTKEIENMRSGKVKKDNMAGEIEAKTKELATAKQQLEYLTGEKAGDKEENKIEQLNQKKLEADRKLEEARISIMEEGYEKRKATLDLQHKKNLEDIDKEERELEKARKDAGKKGLTDDDKKGFSSRRDYENQSYNKEQNKLFDGEVSYKKEQYALYFRWVKNMGEDIANAQFAKLLQGGSSYKDYVEKQIKDLKAKQASGSNLSNGEANQLITLNMQYDEITGAKSAMDQFKESVTETIGQAQTLAEKLQAVADARSKLDNGSSGLVGDEKAEGSLIISQEEEKLQKEIQNELLTNYRSYEDKKKSIQDQYALLRKKAQETENQDLITQVNKGETEALSTLNAQMLMQSDSWKQLFGDLDALSAAQIDQLLEDIEKQLQNAELKLNPVDYRELTDSLNKAKETLITKNPFKVLGKFYDDYVAAKKRLAKAKAKLAGGKGSEEEVTKAQNDLKKASSGVFKSINEITTAASDCAGSLSNMFSSLGMDSAANGLETAIELMGSLGGAAEGVGKLMSGDIMGGITGIVSGVTSAISVFAKLHDSKYEKRIQNLQKEIDALESSYNRLERAFNNTYWVFTDSQKDGYEKNIELINQQIDALQQQAAVAKASWKFKEYAQLTKDIMDLQAALKKAQESGDMFSIYNQQKENLRKQQEDIQKQIQAEKDKKKTDDGKIADWEEKIESINQQIEDLDQSMMETLAGTDIKSAIDEFADALVDAYCKGEDAAEALGAKTKEVLKKAVVDALKRQFLAKSINDAVSYLGEAMQDNILADDEKAKFEAMVKAGADKFNLALSGIGDWIKDTDESDDTDPLTGAVKSMSEETGGLIAGRFNVFVINQSEQTMILRNSLIYQAEIAANTKVSASELSEIKDTLKRIENKDSSLLSQGIA